MSDHRYDLEHYREILEKALELGYRTPRVREVAREVPAERFFLIRHDVDISPWAAETLAELEHELGVTTTYYYRLHAPYYNALAPDVLESIRRVAGLGHEVGLHYEPGFHIARGEDPVEGTRRDIAIFEAALGERTHSIAQHQPAQGPVLEEISKDHPCAYQRALVRDLPYFADSGFHWREGCICTKLGIHDRLHTLIHPHSWVPGDRPWREVLRWHAEDLGRRVRETIENYIVEVEEYLRNRERLDRERERRYLRPD